MAKAFISYVHEDSARVDILVRNLKRNGIGVWVDKHELAGGTRWKKKIREAISDGTYFLSIHSKQRLEKEKTYSAEELLIAIEELRKRPYDKAWLIPVRLDDSDIEDRPIGGGETYMDLHIHDMRDLEAGIHRLLLDLGVPEPQVNLSDPAKIEFGGPLGTPHAALKALQGIQSKYSDDLVDRSSLEKAYGENCISDLVGLGLLVPQKPKKVKLVQMFDDLPLALKVAVAGQPSFQVAVSVLSKNFNAHGYQIGHEISESLGKNWSRGSKVRYGNSYRGWAMMFYPNFRKPAEGESGYAWRRTIEKGTKGHGRRTFMTDEVLQKISRMKADGLSIPQMARQLGCVPNVIYNWKRKYPERWPNL